MRKTLSAIVFAMLASVAWAQTPEMKDDDGLRWICGGIGADERRTLAALQANANLVLTFVTARRGGYLADVEVSISGAASKSPRFATVADGPICLLRLPLGRYRVEAAFGGVRRTAIVAVPGDGKRPAHAVFAFSGEPWDGIWASDEEKAQAREP